MNQLTPSDACIALVKRFESCKLEAYQDTGGVWTIGYGHTAGVVEGQTITQAEAETLLMSDLSESASAVRRLVTLSLLQCEFDALCDFVFNLGAEELEKSHLLVWLNAGQFDKVEADFGLFVHADGKVLPGLVERRQEERRMFAGGVIA